MKKLLLLFCLLIGLSAYAQTLEGVIELDWISKTQIQRDENISQIRDILFKDGTPEYSKKEFKSIFAKFLKDENHKYHYINIKNGRTEDNLAEYSGFFKGKLFYMYAIKYKNLPRNVFYYDTLGNLIYVDILSDEYPNYPYFSSQYKINGNLISKIYFNSDYDQYMFTPNGNFKGRWFKNKMYNEKAKIILTRNNY